MGKVLGFLIGCGLLALIVSSLGQEVTARLEVERAQAETAAAHARADQAQAEAVKAQAEAMAAQAIAQARQSEEQARFYLAALVAVSVWAAALLVIMAWVVLTVVKRQNNQVVYLPPQEQARYLQPGSNLIVWPNQVTRRDLVERR